jgi:glutamate synthase (NADPH/NADH) small chain
VIEAMGAGRTAARSMKAYLGIREIGSVAATGDGVEAATLFGIDLNERNFARVRVPAVAGS